MARPKKERGIHRALVCACCGLEIKSGYGLEFQVVPVEVTPDWFIAYDADVLEYGCHLCSMACVKNYLMEVLDVGGDEGEKEERTGGTGGR